MSCALWWARPSLAGRHLVVLLDGTERARYARFHRAADAERFLAAHALARLVVGHELGVAPQEVGLIGTCRHCGGSHGKPRISDDPELELSLSHSGGWVVVAVNRGAPVGVDIERLRPVADLAALAGRVLSPAERSIGDRAALLRTWTRKEALLKATGDGLSVPMARLTVTPPSEPPQLLRWAGDGAPAAAWLADLAPDSDHVGCVAVLVDDARVVQHRADHLLAGHPTADAPPR